MKASDCYVGLSASKQGVFSCTSNGALRLESGERGSETASTARLPTRLCDWRLSPSTQKFAYGGDEVDLSIWDVEKAFTTPVANTQLLSDTSSSKKRKRSDALLPAEIWRAKNVPNDSLGLRQPVRITSIAYVTSSECHLLVGTQLGDLRRYDIRAARRPISDWKNIGKTGGIRALESGHTENQAFVSDGASNLFAMDLRTGRVIYAYKGISGAVTSIAPSTSVMVTTSQDRFVRLHSVFPPPSQVSQQQDAKGQVVDKMFMKASPTVISWDQCPDLSFADTRDRADFQEDEDMWEDMEEIGDNERDNRKK
ncbi:hypothetical protein E1B28_008770 [Marasmius oreades]|nr:uncharacterized protein E1B28_008770 [Marasmius oreades]KAG7092413.1 hypothetical protein E1B28_008770 [Marasmius oreades]